MCLAVTDLSDLTRSPGIKEYAVRETDLVKEWRGTTLGYSGKLHLT